MPKRKSTSDDEDEDYEHFEDDQPETKSKASQVSCLKYHAHERFQQRKSRLQKRSRNHLLLRSQNLVLLTTKCAFFYTAVLKPLIPPLVIIISLQPARRKSQPMTTTWRSSPVPKVKNMFSWAKRNV
jgi:hypothetical protein